tara:strand:- start:737 stop:916 length:180 start_codon:yes stop_codon:yes gene_type:complete
VELVLNALFNKDSEEREFTLMVFNPKFLAKGGWIFWLMIGLWALLIFGDFEWVLISVHL